MMTATARTLPGGEVVPPQAESERVPPPTSRSPGRWLQGSVGLLIAAALLGPAPALAQTGAPARLYVFADSVWPGERVVVGVAVDHRPGVQTLFPEPPVLFPETAPGLSFGDAEALDVRRLPPTVRGDVRTDSALYATAVFAADAATIGPVAVRLVLAPGDTAVVQTGVVVLPVRPTGDAVPATGPPLPFPSPVPHAVALALLLAVLVAGALWWRRRQRPTARVAGPPPLAPYPEALARLADLDASPPTTAADAEAHADAIKEVLRVFVARRTGVATRERTTDELAAALGAVRWLPAGATARVADVLRVADRVDFAAWRPAPDALAGVRADARAAVEAVEAAARAHEAPAMAQTAAGA